jgi:L-lysine 2,3-aminomutase
MSEIRLTKGSSRLPVFPKGITIIILWKVGQTYEPTTLTTLTNSTAELTESDTQSLRVQSSLTLTHNSVLGESS